MLFRIAGFKVTVQTLPIASCNDYSDGYFKQLVQFHNGTFALGNRRSRDGGKTWTKAGPWASARTSSPMEKSSLRAATRRSSARACSRRR